VIHVDDAHVRTPLRHDRLGIGKVSSRTNDEKAVMEREFDEIRDELKVVQKKCSTRFAGWCLNVDDAVDAEAVPTFASGGLTQTSPLSWQPE
jgi:hypothetical protein